MASQIYIAGTVPAKPVWVSGTNLFQVALDQMGDPLYWAQIARLNGTLDPWIFGLTEILIPPVPQNPPLTGILGQ